MSSRWVHRTDFNRTCGYRNGFCWCHQKVPLVTSIAPAGIEISGRRWTTGDFRDTSIAPAGIEICNEDGNTAYLVHQTSIAPAGIEIRCLRPGRVHQQPLQSHLRVSKFCAGSVERLRPLLLQSHLRVSKLTTSTEREVRFSYFNRTCGYRNKLI